MTTVSVPPFTPPTTAVCDPAGALIRSSKANVGADPGEVGLVGITRSRYVPRRERTVHSAHIQIA